jgi:hypothetical protein
MPRKEPKSDTKLAKGTKAPGPDSVIAGEHIFPATKLTKLAVRWKELNAANRHREAMVILEEIIKDSTPMFERLAQHEDYDFTVDLKILVAAAQEKVVRWLLHWNPVKGRLFTFFSKCSKNAFRSEVVKVNQYRKRFYVTDENPERLFGFHDPTLDKNAGAELVHRRMNEISARWGSPQELGAIRYILACMEDIQDGVHDRQAVIKGAMFAYGLSLELSKFFYQWSLIALRDAMYRQVVPRFTEQDLFHAQFSYTLLPDLLNNLMSWEQLKKMILIYGGTRWKIPTMTQIEKMKESYEIFEEINETDLSPAAISKVAKRHGKTDKTAEEIFRDMTEVTHPNRTGEHPLFEQINDHDRD